MSTGLIGFDTIGQRQGEADAYISASRLSCWLTCPLKWAYRYLEGIRTPTTPALFVGKACHSGLEIYYRHLQLGITLETNEVTGKFLESWAGLVDQEKPTFKDVADEQALRKQVCGLVEAYLAIAPPNEKPLAVEVAVEAPLFDPESGDDLGMPLVGVIDLVLEGEFGPVIADFKTSSRSSEPMEISHEIQLSSYAWLYRQITGRKEAGIEIRSLIKTKVPKIEFHEYAARTDAHFRRLFSVIREYLDALDSGKFNYRPGFGCAMCDYRTECQGWSG
ncbi:MAG: PD-(D/E)XK nuclease family protein [Planctomycetota bacterium]